MGAPGRGRGAGRVGGHGELGRVAAWCACVLARSPVVVRGRGQAGVDLARLSSNSPSPLHTSLQHSQSDTQWLHAHLSVSQTSPTGPPFSSPSLSSPSSSSSTLHLKIASAPRHPSRGGRAGAHSHEKPSATRARATATPRDEATSSPTSSSIDYLSLAPPPRSTARSPLQQPRATTWSSLTLDARVHARRVTVSGLAGLSVYGLYGMWATHTATMKASEEAYKAHLAVRPLFLTSHGRASSKLTLSDLLSRCRRPTRPSSRPTRSSRALSTRRRPDRPEEPLSLPSRSLARPFVSVTPSLAMHPVPSSSTLSRRADRKRDSALYLPMQNPRKISPRTSSVSTMPVICPSDRTAYRNSSPALTISSEGRSAAKGDKDRVSGALAKEECRKRERRTEEGVERRERVLRAGCSTSGRGDAASLEGQKGSAPRDAVDAARA